MDGSCCNNATDGREALQQTVGKVLHSRGGVATDGWKVLQQVQRNGRGALQQTVGEVLHGRGGVATDGRKALQQCRGVATDGRKALQQMGGRRCNTAEVLQQMVRRCCNKWESECNGRGGVATNRRGETGKMQQDVAIFHGGWTTVNDATAIYGSYCESCNKVPCTLQLRWIPGQAYLSVCATKSSRIVPYMMSCRTRRCWYYCFGTNVYL